MPTSSDTPEPLKNQVVDYVTSGIKASLGAVPFAGSLLTEVAGSIIPNQRIDRIADFAAKLEARIKDLDEQAIRAHLKDEEFTDLVEESLRQASRSTSDERRTYLASLVSQSISSEAITHVESKQLLRLLGEINDLEVLWLRFFLDPVINGDKEFRELHKDVFKHKTAYIGCSTEELDDHALQESYKNHLEQLGLVTRHISKRGGTTEFDKFTGGFKYSYTDASILGKLLLRSINLTKKQ